MREGRHSVGALASRRGRLHRVWAAGRMRLELGGDLKGLDALRVLNLAVERSSIASVDGALLR